MASLVAGEPARRKAREAAAEALGPGHFFEGAALRAAKDRAAAGEVLSTPFADVVISLVLSAAIGIAFMLTLDALSRLGTNGGVV